MADNTTPEYDVVVIGGGLAGLTAAKHLIQKNRKVAVLEARDRWGGRVFTHRDEKSGTHMELGATWVGPTQDEILDLLKEYKLDTHPTYNTGKNIQHLSGQTGTYSGTIPPLGILALLDLHFSLNKIDKFASTINTEEPWKSENAEYWDNITADAFLRKHVNWTATARAAADVLIRMVLTCEASQMSALYFLLYVANGGNIMRLAEVENGAQQDVIAAGSSALPEAIAKDLANKGARMVLREVVTEVHQTQDMVIVKTRNNSTYTAKYAVVATPPSLAVRLRYEPPLPAAKDRLMSQFPAGSIIKTIMIYDKPYWRQAGFTGQIVSDAPQHPVTYSIDHCSADGKLNALIGFIVSNKANEWRSKSSDERKAAIVNQYAELFGIPEMKSPINYMEKDWCEEEFSRGCYVGLTAPGVLTQYGKVIREPFERVYFASTETATKWMGYMDGACRAGRYVADQINSKLEN